jgi:hypothetical protein
MKKFKPMPSEDEILGYKKASDLIRSLEETAKSKGFAIFKPIKIDCFDLYFAKMGNGMVRLVWGDRPLLEYSGKKT